jgi:hypothetical protein
MTIQHPYIQLSTQADYAGFYVMTTTDAPLKLDSITLIGALRDAINLGYSINKKQWVDSTGAISPILFDVN